MSSVWEGQVEACEGWENGERLMTTEEKEEEVQRHNFTICDEHGNTIHVAGGGHIVTGEGALRVWDEGYDIYEASPRGWSWIKRGSRIHMVKKKEEGE